ncbi:hypothetical protein [Streptomyces sp. NPDC056160]|uniref:hypothetical protein n=1 Tax=Streptomyces sp. NPDC056160 TaxID=3345731 RepID=UPI0035DADB32
MMQPAGAAAPGARPALNRTAQTNSARTAGSGALPAGVCRDGLARVAAVVDIAATVFVTNSSGGFHRRHLLTGARRHLAPVLRGRRREPGLDADIVDAALATYCVDISEPKTLRGPMPSLPPLHRPLVTGRPHPDCRRPPTTAPTGSHQPTRAHPPRPGLRG